MAQEPEKIEQHNLELSDKTDQGEEQRMPIPEQAGAQLKPWFQFAKFCDENWRYLTPRAWQDRRARSNWEVLEKKCSEMIFSSPPETWRELLAHFRPQRDRRIVEDFISYARGRKASKSAESPRQLQLQVKADVEKFADYALLAFNRVATDRDLMKLNAMADLGSEYQGSSRVYLFLVGLATFLEPEPLKIVTESHGFQMLLRCGPTKFLSEFWISLQRRFRITRVALKSEAAENLAREFSETETNLREQLEEAQATISEQEQLIEKLTQEANEEAVYQLGRTLQGQPSPVLDELFTLHRNLLIQEAEAQEPLDGLALNVLIVIENLLKGLTALGIESYPAKLEEPLTLTAQELTEYSYVAGTPFENDGSAKSVDCIKPGWRIKGRIITPARVQERAPGGEK